MFAIFLRAVQKSKIKRKLVQFFAKLFYFNVYVCRIDNWLLSNKKGAWLFNLMVDCLKLVVLFV
jgi:predicted transcriptional regulator with HTH domain